jgi:hypothetical protein
VAVIDVLLLAVMFLVCGGIGLPIADQLPVRMAGRRLLAPALGLGVLAVGVPVGYRAGLSIFALLIASAAIALACWAWRGRQLVRELRAASGDARRELVAIAVGWFAIALVLILPRWTGGDQFAVFQGNMWDSFGYLQPSVVYARRSYAEIHAATGAALIRHPLYAFAQSQLDTRPAVNLLYALFSRFALASSYRLYYTFLAGCLAQLALVLVFLVRSAVPKASPWLWLAAAAVFPLGFWGQYSFDINAWSQLAALPMLLTMVALVLHAASGPLLRGDALRVAGVLAVAIAGATYMYPEATAIYVAVLGPFAVAAALLQMIRARRLALRALVPVVGFAGVAAIALSPPLVRFLVAQFAAGVGVKRDWWTYFQAFFFGRAVTSDHPTDFVAGVFGLYFATPARGTSPVVEAIERGAIAATVVAIVAAIVVAIVFAASRARDPASPVRPILIAWAVLAVLLLGPAAALFHQENYWSAGKALAYVAPVFMTLLAAMVAVPTASYGRALWPLRWFAAAFVAFQIALGLARIDAARSPSGIHYALPYPSGQAPGFKTNLGWDLSGLDDHLRRSDHVLVRSMSPWPEAYLMMYLYVHRIDFTKEQPVNAYFGTGETLGQMAVGTPNVEISVEAEAIVLHYPDGRPDVRVPSRSD